MKKGRTKLRSLRSFSKKFKIKGIELNENDFVIVCGDLGLCWAKDKTIEYNCKFFDRSHTLLQGLDFTVMDRPDIDVKTGAVA